MTRDWEGFQNTQNYIECQLVSALNAYYYLTGEQILIGSEGYEELVDLTNGRNMPCLCMSPVYERLGIKIKKTFDSHEEFMNNLVFPMEKIVFGASHSVLIVDWEPKNKRLRVTNFNTTNEGWISEESFFRSIEVKDRNYGSYKLFDLV
jgi:hypothetical protein